MILVWFEVVIDEQQFTARQLNKKIFHSPQKNQELFIYHINRLTPKRCALKKESTYIYERMPTFEQKEKLVDILSLLDWNKKKFREHKVLELL